MCASNLAAHTYPKDGSAVEARPVRAACAIPNRQGFHYFSVRHRAAVLASSSLLCACGRGDTVSPATGSKAGRSPVPPEVAVLAAEEAALGSHRRRGLREVDWGIDSVRAPNGRKPAEVQIFKNALVTCKGQVFIVEGRRKALDTVGVHYDGCGYFGGSCNNTLRYSHVSQESYCVIGGFCVPYAPQEDKPAGPVETLVALTQPQHGAYYHFVVDSLSRISWLWHQYPSVVQDRTTVFHTGFIGDSGQVWARLVGIDTASGDKNRLVDGYWTAKKVYWPPSNGCANKKIGAEPFAVRGVQAGIARSLKKSSGPSASGSAAARTALLVRRDQRTSKHRSVLNHDEVFAEVAAELKEWNVEVFSDYPSSPDVATTCGLFHRADLIIGPHGAGFSNLLCARPGVPLIEFQQINHAADFQLLALKLGMPYIGVRTYMVHNGPCEVNITWLHEAIALALHSTGSAVRLEPNSTEVLIARIGIASALVEGQASAGAAAQAVSLASPETPNSSALAAPPRQSGPLDTGLAGVVAAQSSAEPLPTTAPPRTPTFFSSTGSPMLAVAEVHSVASSRVSGDLLPGRAGEDDASKLQTRVACISFGMGLAFGAVIMLFGRTACVWPWRAQDAGNMNLQSAAAGPAAKQLGHGQPVSEEFAS